MESLLPLLDLLIILSLAFVGGIIAKKLHQPLILGYVLSGIFLGGFIVNIYGSGFVGSLGEIGVAFLMFSLGIEFSFNRLLRVKNIAIWGAIIQILVIILLGLIIFPLFKFDFITSLFLSACFSLSSTAVVTKILAEKGELDSLPGEIMVGWLLVQDLAVLPMILLLPRITDIVSNPGELVFQIAKSFSLLLLIFVFGKAIIPKILNKVASYNSRELIILAVVSMCLLAAFVTFNLGLSFTLGAFLAGLLVSESAENHAVFSEIRPLRDIFSIIFFVSLGMMLAPTFLFNNLLIILMFTGIVLFLKFFTVLFLTLYLGYHLKIAFWVGAGLFQVGEFSFILSKVGLNQGLISTRANSIIVSVALLSIMLTPFVLGLAPKVYVAFGRLLNKYSPKLYERVYSRRDRRFPDEELPLENHIVICGYGRVGGWLGRALMLSQIPFVVVDYNHEVVADLKNKGVPVVYGDPADRDVLDYAQVDKAKTVVVAIPDRHTQELVISNALSLNPKINIVCRIHHQEDRARLKTLGVQTIIQPEFEASLSIIHRIIQDFGYSKEEVNSKIKRIKIEYGMA